MTKSELYRGAARHFTTDRAAFVDVATTLRRYVQNQARTIRELIPSKALRCAAYLTSPIDGRRFLSCEFWAPRGRNYIVSIAIGGRSIVTNHQPVTVDVPAAYALLALIVHELRLPVTLQP